MKKNLIGLLLGLFTLLAGFGLSTASAQTADKPFADVKVVLQISDNNPFKQTLVLNVANNLIKHYGPDKVDIEIVAFGPGLRLLFEENVNTGHRHVFVSRRMTARVEAH